MSVAVKTSQASPNLMYTLSRAFVFGRTWKDQQRRFDAYATYDVLRYHTLWEQGYRYIARPRQGQLAATIEECNDMCTHQIIRHLSAFNTEVCKWRLGLKSVVTDGHDRLRKDEMPLAKVEPYKPIFYDGAVPFEQGELSHNAVVESMSRSLLTFTLERRVSPYGPPVVEKGVYLRGSAVPGQLVAVYPGLLYPPGHSGETLKTENSDVWLRLQSGGGNTIDASEYDILNLIGVPHHPLAFGQWINHPPAEVHPNLLKFTVVLYPDFPRHLLALLPMRWSGQPGFTHFAATANTSRRAIMFAVVYLAARHIRNEELFAEARIRPGLYPDWYTPYREERNYRTYGMRPPWNPERDVTRSHDGVSVGTRPL